jgi:hypothetical protein
MVAGVASPSGVVQKPMASEGPKNLGTDQHFAYDDRIRQRFPWLFFSDPLKFLGGGCFLLLSKILLPSYSYYCNHHNRNTHFRRKIDLPTQHLHHPLKTWH